MNHCDILRLVGVALWLAFPVLADAAPLRHCGQPAQPSVAQKDKLLRFAAVVKDTLESSGQRLALVSRSGLDLSRFSVRYSHAGFSIKSGLDTPWAVRQLYYACDEERSRLYDQGMSGFVLGTDEPTIGYLSVVFLPPDAAAALERAALDKQQVLKLLSADYSANAYPFSLRYQNCNQWVVELLAVALSGTNHHDGPNPRLEAQRWLQDQSYVPSVFALGSAPLMWLAGWTPWLHNDDHPSAELEQLRYLVSMPASIEKFIRQQLPSATRIELCHTDSHIVLHRGWDAVADGCVAAAGDKVIALD